MDKHQIVGSYKNLRGKIHVELLLKGWKDNETNLYFLYSPALDLTGYGETLREAQNSLKYTLDEFIRYTHTKKTIFDELEHLGWYVNRKKKRVCAPDINDLLKENKTFRTLQSKKGVRDLNKAYNLELA